VRIIGFGDSHMHGESFARKAAERCAFEFVEKAVPGERIAQTYERALSIDFSGGDTLVISSGTNDIPHGPWGGMLEIANYAEKLASGFGCNVMFCTIPPCLTLHEDNLIRAANSLIKDACARHGKTVFDTHSLLTRTDGGIGNPADYRDFVHMSDRGNSYLGDMLYLEMMRSSR